MALAWLLSARAKKVSFSAKVKSPLLAESALEKPLIVVALLPTTSPSTFSAISLAVKLINYWNLMSPDPLCAGKSRVDLLLDAHYKPASFLGNQLS